MDPRASPGPSFRGKPRGMNPERFKMDDPAFGRVHRAAAVDVCTAKVENGHHPAIVIYIDDLYLPFLSKTLLS
jgi:hypothetical protein